ncbi:DegT/DnrJ/EryC1/StrS family aminotransferase [Pollutibacter soli]|uniref:DegT/DnrJ/EryC1/StrS family aminotransferase n=1 Tax=Pollutibacter soli TaxID=3034157 RepID=UPI003013FF71
MPGFELFGDDERKEVNEVLESGILMRYGFDAARKGRWKAKELEAAICKELKVNHAQVVSSGTAALTTALASLGIGAGDEVIMPVFTFVASFEAVLSVGASPVLTDVDETLTLDPQAVEEAITPNTRCIMPVHMCGGMADMDALKSIASKYNLPILEDACQAIGASFKGNYLGTIGNAGALSFDFVKTITCGEGGAVITNNKSIADSCDAFSDHGHDHLGKDRGADLHPFLGYNFRISELHAAVGLAQLRKLKTFVTMQRERKAILKESIGNIRGISFRKLPDPAGDNAAFLTFFLPNEKAARETTKAIQAAGLSAFYWFDNNWHYIRKWNHLKAGQSLYGLHADQLSQLQKLNERNFTQSDSILSRTISMPVSLSWSIDNTREKAQKLSETLSSMAGVLV